METQRRDKPLGRTLLFLLWGPILWSGHGAVIYAVQSALCAWNVNIPILGTDLVTAFILAATLGLVAAIALVMAAAKPVYRRIVWPAVDDQVDEMLVSAMRILGVLSIAGMIWLGSAVFLLDSCAQAR